MSGLIGEVLNQTRSLQVHQQGVQTAGRNLANVNNPAYARQRVDLDGNVGTLSASPTVGQVRDAILDRQIVFERSVSSSLNAAVELYQRLDEVLGERLSGRDDSVTLDGANPLAGSDSGLSGALLQFFNAFHEISAAPEDPATRAAVIHASEELVLRFQEVDGDLTALEAEIRERIGAASSRANELAEEVARLNGEIARFEIRQAGSALDLRDARQAALEELSGLLNITVRPSTAGDPQVDVLLQDDTGADIPFITGNALTNALTADPATGTLTAGGAAVALSGGQMHGWQSVINDGINPARAGINAVASQLVSTVNAAYGQDYFVATGATAASIALDPTLNASSLRTTATATPGANELALAIADLGDTTFTVAAGAPFDGTFREMILTTAATAGADARAVEERQTHQAVVDEMLKGQRAALGGVSQDEEAADLMRFQRSFQAGARVVNTLDQLLDTVVNSLLR